MKRQKTKAEMIRWVHILMHELGFDAQDKKALLAEYGVESSNKLSLEELREVCGRLEGARNPLLNEADKWRKRAIAAIGGFLAAGGKEGNINIIKAIALRATECGDFNRIPIDKLRGLYFGFSKQAKVMREAEKISRSELVEMCREIHQSVMEEYTNKQYKEDDI